MPGIIARLASARRSSGDRVECLVLATPVAESRLGTLQCSLTAQSSGGRSVLRVGWSVLAETALIGPALRDRAEQSKGFDRIAITLQVPPDNRDGVTLPFAFESLAVERACPRSEADLSALLSDWEKLHPLVAAPDNTTSPPADLRAVDAHLRALVTDPASRIDFSQPDPDPVTHGPRSLALVPSSPSCRPDPTPEGLVSQPDAIGSCSLSARGPVSRPGSSGFPA
jgi:hypothetical protein